MRLRLKTALLALLFGACATLASAQTVALPTQHIGFDETQPLSVASAASYKVYLDAAPAQSATGLSCSAQSGGASCQIDIPAMTPGLHTVKLSQAIAGFESAQ